MSSTQFAPSIPTKRLAAAIVTTDMSFTLNNILSWTGMQDLTTKLVTADFPTNARGCFRNPANNQIEFFIFDPATIANATITILARGLDYRGGSVDGVGTKYNWPANSTLVELGTNTPLTFEDYIDKFSDESVSGLKTFVTLPQSTPVPVANSDLVNKLYADTHGGVATNYDQNIIAGVAGENLTTGWAVYLKTTDGKWYGTAAGAAATCDGVLLGIAQATVLSGAAVNVLVGGVDKTQSGLTLGSVYYLSNTKGLIATTPGTISVVIGQCNTTATQLVLSQRFTQMPTALQNLALVGNDVSIAVGSGNKFVTQSGLQHSTESYAADSGAADVLVITLSPVPASLTAGMEIKVKVNHTNLTTTPTINVNGLGAKAITKNGTATLSPGDLLIGQVVVLVYDGTQFQLQTPATPSILSLIPNLAGGTAGITTAVIAGNTTAIVELFSVHAPITVNKISIRITASSVTGTYKLGIFSQDGSIQYLNVSTASIAGAGIKTTTVTPFTLPSGNYYLVIVPVSTVSATFVTWTISDQLVYNVSPVILGVYTVSADTMPSTITPASVTASGSIAPLFRLDN